MMILERFEEKHMTGVLSLWNKELGASYPMRPRLLRQNVLEDSRVCRAGSWIARETAAGEVIGFVIVKMPGGEDGRFGLRSVSGWIQALLVASAWRGQGIGSALLGKAEAALQSAGRIVLGNDLHRRMFPGIPAELEAVRRWFERRNYERGDDVFDLINFYADGGNAGMPEFGEAAVRIADSGDRDALTAFMARCFPGAWDLQHRDYWEQGGSGREYVLLEKAGSIIGFCRINDTGSPLLAQNIYWAPLFGEAELGGIGPLGIDEAYRGQRYGLSIVQAAIHFLRARGIGCIVIDTTPFVDFYGKLGYKIWKKYTKYDKHLDAVKE